jgi:hypothetical protein
VSFESFCMFHICTVCSIRVTAVPVDLVSINLCIYGIKQSGRYSDVNWDGMI